MPFVPLPFVVALLLFILLAVVIRRDSGSPRNMPLLALITISMWQSVLSGLRWGYDIRAVMFLAPVGAALVPPLVYAGVIQLVRGRTRLGLRRIMVHAIPALAVVLLLLTSRDVIDVVLISEFIGYAFAILLLMRPGADALRAAPFEDVAPAYRAILFAASSLLLSAAVDTFVALDLLWTHGEYVPPVIAIGNLCLLVILSVAAASTGSPPEPATAASLPPDVIVSEDTETLAVIEVLMQVKRVYRDVDLNLDRLARKAGIPARQISLAINRATGKNVSQFVNEQRIAESCQLLAETDRSVTDIMFDVGFQTKSNFNREFKRVTEMTPLQWRQRATSIAI
ncbi:AraC family transcriptional regulator [Rhizobium sp. NFR03]|uniref:helix-turn-helix domain-containing protein n=1 Tax=Rhizobium sp. NFR03 TaxID=1566263 RepID=UPI0008B2914F|nr:AraC family transcriptional regulator [Rhizobium sp. NFR03]SER71106.1 AraC-type DNA-binding protein [Rhizobium sp. NFR03]